MKTRLELKKDSRTWFVSMADKPIAEIYLDYCDQVLKVALNADASASDQLQVLKLAASHVSQFVKDRSTTVFGGLIVAVNRNNNLTEADSDRLMDFSLIPDDIYKADKKTITEKLQEIGIEMIVTLCDTPTAISHAVSEVDAKNLEFKALPNNNAFSEQVVVEFKVAQPNRFTFWKNESKPGGGGNLYIVPPYHPVMKGWKSASMVNGDTDANIGGNTVISIFCPSEARSDGGKRQLFTSWNHVNHPYRAGGQSVILVLDSVRVRSVKGIGELADILNGALNLHKRYVDICGGFNPPLESSHNRLVRTKIHSPYPGADYSRQTANIVRGSEAHCVWAYRILEEEGVLDKSYVPSWFLPEGWLDIYKDAEVRVGQY